MLNFLRFYFIAFYAIGLAVLLLKVLPSGFRTTSIENRAVGLARYLPAILLPFNWILPPAAMLLGVGEISAQWPLVRSLGFLLSIYAVVMLLWAPATLGKFMVPQAIVVRDHELITHGPYRYLRHPTYSGDLALWLSAALGTLSALLLLLWPVAVLGTIAQARAEERLLASKFGASFEQYAQRTGRLIPRLRRRNSGADV